MSSILILGAGTQALAIVKSLHKSGNRLIFLVNETGNYSDVSRYVNKRIVSSFAVTSEDYLLLVKKQK